MQDAFEIRYAAAARFRRIAKTKIAAIDAPAALNNMGEIQPKCGTV